jgi:dipeptidyl aminopeptidase/acylaminoacyl peptidase
MNTEQTEQSVDPEVVPYGLWPSPITAELLSSGWSAPLEVAVDGEDVYWLELRPDDDGRAVVVRRQADGRISDASPPTSNVRSRVFEYGGGAFAVHDGNIWYSELSDGRVYRIDHGSDSPSALTPAGPFRYADPQVDARRGRSLWVREASIEDDILPTHSIVSVPDAGGIPTVLISGNDFYAAPRLSPDGIRLAWIQWNVPNMPWDGTELWTAEVTADGELANHQFVAGGPAESILQPTWSPEGRLFFGTDRSGWWNLHYANSSGEVIAVHNEPAEFVRTLWTFGAQAYAFASEDLIVCGYNRDGRWHVGTLTVSNGKLVDLGLAYTFVSDVSAASGRAWFLGGSPTQLFSVVELDLSTRETRVLQRSLAKELDPAYLPRARPIEFPTDGGVSAHALFFEPINPTCVSPDGELPPLIVSVHGGPTNQAIASLELDPVRGAICYWTSRGFAVVSVNYGGSTGYGRAYRERLRGKWGLVDVADSVNAAKWVTEQGIVDGDRLAIRGTSAGGYTALCAIAFHDVFHVACSYFGLTELDVYAADTHKFESRYLDGLVPANVRRERSPVYSVANIHVPTMIQQGGMDKVVLPNQATLMVDALDRQGVPHEYLLHQEEGHGFRRADSLRRCVEAEESFYLRAFGLAQRSPPDGQTSKQTRD